MKHFENYKEISFNEMFFRRFVAKDILASLRVNLGLKFLQKDNEIVVLDKENKLITKILIKKNGKF